MKAEFFAAVVRSCADAKQDFATRHKGSQSRGAISACVLAGSSNGGYQSRTRMHPRARKAQAVLLKGMHAVTVGQSSQGRLQPRTGTPEHAAGPARTVARCVGRHGLAPG